MCADDQVDLSGMRAAETARGFGMSGMLLNECGKKHGRIEEHAAKLLGHGGLKPGQLTHPLFAVLLNSVFNVADERARVDE